VSQCHCGTTREDALRQAEAAGAVAQPSSKPRVRRSGPPLRWGPLGRDIKALVIGIVIVALLGLVRHFWPDQPERVVPVLGHVDAVPSPTPKPTPQAKPKAKSWLPWR
jgi:hypothetical protein